MKEKEILSNFSFCEWDKEISYRTGISNYYGSLRILFENDAYYLALENYDGDYKYGPIKIELVSLLIEEMERLNNE